ncbi:MAG: hypothetical protein WAW39_14630, partial [Prosthecobacter sp.]|uniref:hypothetical protein n=1 Tax=Prosthecobacter sp. TaxID=1965333 RepID=UPI003BAFF843
ERIRKRLTKSAQDLERKTSTSRSGKMEKIFKRYIPQIIDNSSPEIDVAMKQILKRVGVR